MEKDTVERLHDLIDFMQEETIDSVYKIISESELMVSYVEPDGTVSLFPNNPNSSFEWTDEDGIGQTIFFRLNLLKDLGEIVDQTLSPNLCDEQEEILDSLEKGLFALAEKIKNRTRPKV